MHPRPPSTHPLGIGVRSGPGGGARRTKQNKQKTKKSNNAPTLEGPPDEHLRGVARVPLRNSLDSGGVHLPADEWAIRLHDDCVRGAVCDDGLLLAEWV